MTPKAERTDIYERVTATIIDRMEAIAREGNAAPFFKPWDPTQGLPRNGSSGRQYSGVNVLLLSLTAMLKGYASPEWWTYEGAKRDGGQVRKGEKATTVVYWNRWTPKEQREEANPKARMFLKGYSVFNRAQIDGLPEPDASTFEPLPEPAAVIAATGADIVHGSSRAAYSPDLDRIVLPSPEAFRSPADYYAVALHELGHWTGHASRLARDLTGEKGGEQYAREELIAELAAAFTCAATGVEGKLQHPEYLAAWVKVLKDDRRAIVQAASAAQKAADYILSRKEATDSDDSEEAQAA